jgi:uncharacterized membrane protein
MNGQNRSTIWLLIIGLVLISAGIRFYKIAAKDVWLDEANTVRIAEEPVGPMIDRLKLDSSPPLYYLMLHCWMKLFGQSETAIRGLSALLGVLLVAAVFLVARRLFNPGTGLLAAAFTALSPIQVMYSQETRMYTLLPILSLLAFYFFLKFLEDPRPVVLALSVLFTFLSLFTHNFGFFLLPVQFFMLLISKSRPRAFLKWFISLVIIFILYLPWLPLLLFQIRNDTNYAWIAQIWRIFGFFGSLFQTLQSFSAAGDHLKYISLRSGAWISFFSVAAVIAGVLTGSIFLIRDKKTAGSRVRLYHCLIYLGLPLFLAGIGSLIFAPVYVAGRTDQLVYPAFVIILAVLIAAIQFRPVKYLLIAAVAALSLLTLKDYYRINYKTGDRQIAETILRHARPGDALVFTNLTRASVEYYLRRSQSRLSMFSYPGEMAAHMGNISIENMLKDTPRLISDADSLAARIKDGKFNRVYLLFVASEVNDFLFAALEDKLPVKEMIRLGQFRQSLVKTKVDLVLIEL